MKTAEKTIVVTAVNPEHVDISVDGVSHRITWQILNDACSQSDAELSREYRAIRQQAREMAADGPVVVEVCQDDSHVWWVCRVYAAYGHGPANFAKRRDEGGTLPDFRAARREAQEISARLGARLHQQIGF